ncbi:MAG: amino acid ABC transporter permease [Oscillospiraceae bacterium]
MSLSFLSEIWPAFMQGLAETLKLFCFTLLFALPLGLPFALGSRSKFLPLKWLCRTYVWIFRGTPLLLQLFFIYYGLGIMGLPLSRFTAAVLTFVLNYAAYFAEIYRGGIQSIATGQHEAAKTLGFKPWQTMRYIILPQAIARIIPPVCNETITLIKDTALVTAIGVAELLKAAKDAVNRNGNVAAYFVAAVIYLILTFGLTMLYEKIEKHFNRHEQKDA